MRVGFGFRIAIGTAGRWGHEYQNTLQSGKGVYVSIKIKDKAFAF